METEFFATKIDEQVDVGVDKLISDIYDKFVSLFNVVLVVQVKFAQQTVDLLKPINFFPSAS